jgi:hypothetical protein
MFQVLDVEFRDARSRVFDLLQAVIRRCAPQVDLVGKWLSSGHTGDMTVDMGWAWASHK